MADILHIDVETRSTVDLPKSGAYNYFSHPTTDLWCAAYAFGNEEPQLWLPGNNCPAKIADHIFSGGLIAAWNSSFERNAWNKILGPRYKWPIPAIEQYRCTMTEALAMALPGKLEEAAPAIGLEIRKDEKGHRLMMQMCRPRLTRNDTVRWWDEDDSKKHALYEYCKQDVRVEQAVHARVLRLNAMEQELFSLDARINDRGVYVDYALCQKAKHIVASETGRMDADIRAISEGEITACTNVHQISKYVKNKKLPIESLAKDILADLLVRDDLPDDVRSILELRRAAAKTSTAKIDAMLARRESDGRMRGNLQFCGAGATGRWAARGAQLQNLPRPEIIKGDGESFARQYNSAIANIMRGDVNVLTMLYGRPMTVIADCLRGMICAPAGKELLAADFSNIEGRVVAWLAGQEDKLDAFRAFDDGSGPDLYLVAASGVYGVPVTEAKPFRQVGKVCELALGYQGGPGAFAKMAKGYGLKVGDLYGPIWERAEKDFRDAAERGWEQRGKRSGMGKNSWLAAEVIKLAWRHKNHKIRDLWQNVEAAAIDAVANPGKIFESGKVQYRMVGSFLWCRLPSGRALCYPYPRFEEMVKILLMDDFGEDYEDVVPRWKAEKDKSEIVGRASARLMYKAVDQQTKRWGDKIFYGGLGTENITQAVARDVMAESMLRLEKANYPVILTVHDEVVAEVDKGWGSLEEFSDIMTQNPFWAEDLPITAGGWRGVRYRKG